LLTGSLKLLEHGEYPIISSQIYQSSFIWSLKTNNLKSMKTITLQLYTFDELSEEVQKEIIERERWNIMDQCMEAYGSDYVTSLRTFEKLTNTQSCSWSVNYSGYNFNFKYNNNPIFECPIDCSNDIYAEELCGKLLF